MASSTKKPYSVGYFSSYDRGLECLLDMWPEIKKQVPKATLDIYYGWDMYDQFHSKDPAKMKWRWQMTRKIHDVGAVEHGRVNHQQLADAMKEIKVWAYPTEFTEIHCITALKAQEAEMIPVVTDVGALNETVLCGYTVTSDNIYTDKTAQKEFISEVVDALKSKTKGVSTSKNGYRPYWNQVAEVWDKELA